MNWRIQGRSSSQLCSLYSSALFFYLFISVLQAPFFFFSRKDKVGVGGGEELKDAVPLGLSVGSATSTFASDLYLLPPLKIGFSSRFYGIDMFRAGGSHSTRNTHLL